MIISQAVPLAFSVTTLCWARTYAFLLKRSHWGPFTLAWNIARNPSPEQQLEKALNGGDFIHLSDRQRATLEELKVRLGVTRRIEFVWEDRKLRERDAYLHSNPRFSSYGSLSVIGCRWPDRYPAVISIRSRETLRDLESPERYKEHTTSILHEIAHIKRRDGNNRLRRIFGLFAYIAAIAAGIFTGERAGALIGFRHGDVLGFSAGLLVGSLFCNAIMGLMVLRMQQETEALAVRASTVEELQGSMRGLAMSLHIPYWKLLFYPSSDWRDPAFVSHKKTHKVFREKSEREGTWDPIYDLYYAES